MNGLILPKNWEEITVREYLKFLNANDVLEQVSILSKKSVYSLEIMRLTNSDVREIKKRLLFMQTAPKETPEILIIDDVEYLKKPINKINVFEWRSYEFFTREKNELNIQNMIAVMYQKQGEEWGYDLNKRAEIFLDAPMNFWNINEWAEFRKLCFEKYPLAGDKTGGNDVQNMPEKENYLERSRRLEAERVERINSALNWEKIMLSLCNDSLKESYEAMYLPVLYVFRVLTLRKE